MENFILSANYSLIDNKIFSIKKNNQMLITNKMAMSRFTRFTNSHTNQSSYVFFENEISPELKDSIYNQKSKHDYSALLEKNQIKQKYVFEGLNLAILKYSITKIAKMLAEISYITNYKIILRLEKKRTHVVTIKTSNIDITIEKIKLTIHYQLKTNKLEQEFICNYITLNNEQFDITLCKKKLLSEIYEKIFFYSNLSNVQCFKKTVNILFSSKVASVIMHECFGHFAEIDNKNILKGNEFSTQEWLSIIDDGSLTQNGYTPFDEEGTKAKKTIIIKNGKFSCFLNSLEFKRNDSQLTGNFRTPEHSYRPLVRATNTYLDSDIVFPATGLLEELNNGFYLKSIKLAYVKNNILTVIPDIIYYKEKKIHPVSISRLSIEVFDIYKNICKAGDDFSFHRNVCFKQFNSPLDIGLGSSSILLSNCKINFKM